ncbi:hypothetical protein, conserved [Eimeria maxima]|uniref:Uncharacterized protein n=1 Tax=Eimeria maxima TaxID=5804 RepID=U6LYG5_EIMMA|nr:hypothetical protein, conserved [Eimeria maxima]CDJ56997.1 hypothetical protein, conserved [Eimeria maxima]
MRLISLFKLATLAASGSTAAEAAAAAAAAAAVAASPAVTEAQTGAATPEAAVVMLSTLPKMDSASWVRRGVPLRDGALQRQQRQAVIAAAVAAFVSVSAVIFLVMRCSQFLVPKASEIYRRALASGGSSGSSADGGAASAEDTSSAAAGSCSPLMSFPTLSSKELESAVSLQMQQLSLTSEEAAQLSPSEAEQVASAQRMLQELRALVLALGNLVAGFEKSLQEDARDLRVMIGELQPGSPTNAAVLQLQADIRTDRTRLSKWKWQLKEMQEQLYRASHSTSQAQRCKGLLAARFFKRFSVSSAAAAALAAAQTVLNSTNFGGRSSSSSRSNSGSRSSGSKTTRSSSIRRTFSSRGGDKKPPAVDEGRGRHRVRKGTPDHEQLMRELHHIQQQQQLSTQLQQRQILADLRTQVLQGMFMRHQQRQQQEKDQEKQRALQERSLLQHQPRRNGRRGRGVAEGSQHTATDDDSGQTGASSSDRRGRSRRRQNKMPLKMPLSYIAEEASEEDDEAEDKLNVSQLSAADLGDSETDDERTACR